MHAHLDNPVWHAITTKHSALGHKGNLACCYQRNISPFAAVREPTMDALLDLHDLIPDSEPVLVQSLSSLPPVPYIESVQSGSVLQMIAAHAPGHVVEEGVRRLGSADVADMMRLVETTRPGPFGSRTIEMGNYIGIHDQGRLIAMAGERMKLDGFVEISAVCVDDAYRGRGLAARLINTLRREILRRGEVPFLHVLSDNIGAISVYRRLGFEDRQLFRLSVLRSVNGSFFL